VLRRRCSACSHSIARDLSFADFGELGRPGLRGQNIAPGARFSTDEGGYRTPLTGTAGVRLLWFVLSSHVIPCPMKLGDVSFHHGEMPHMTTPNASSRWRRALSQHFRALGTKGEGDHYPWKIYVNQITGERIKPAVR
jgi:hypothetical protein